MSDFETVPVGTMKELEKMKEEHDALKAHFHRLAKKVIEHCSGPLPGTAQMELLREAGDVLRDLPSTSLDRLIAEKQADALERLRELLKETHMAKAPTVARTAIHVDDAISRVKQECVPLKLRSQAEGGES